jgi:ribonuclease D
MELVMKGKSDLTIEELIGLNNSKYIAIDTETTGLSALKDKLCTIQIYNGYLGYLFNFDSSVNYVNLKKILCNPNIVKVFHNAIFDVNFLVSNLDIKVDNIVCTKISSKIINGLESDNSLKGLIKKYLKIDINKNQQLSDWGKIDLSKEQIEYAMNDVKYLYNLWLCLEQILIDDKLLDVAYQCFKYIPTYITLHNKGIENIFTY